MLKEKLARHRRHYVGSWTRGYKTLVQSQTQNKAQLLVACGHVSASSQSLCFILSMRMNSSFITSKPRVSHFIVCLVPKMVGKRSNMTGILLTCM